MPDEAPSLTVTGMLNAWLTRIEGKVDVLDAKLDGKVDKHEVEALAARLDQESARIDVLDREMTHQKRTQAETTEGRRYRVPVAIAVVSVVIGVLGVLVAVLQLLHH